MSDVPGLVLPSYFEHYRAPVKLERTESGGIRAWRMSADTGGWERANHLIDKVLFAHGGETFVLSQEEFVQLVESERAHFHLGSGAISALYETIKGVLDVAEAEGRSLTDSEETLVGALRRKTFVMFERELQDNGDPGADPRIAQTGPSPGG